MSDAAAKNSTESLEHGILNVTLQSWNQFHEFVYQRALEFNELIWRGQRCDNWLLEPTLDRALDPADGMGEWTRKRHLANFKRAVSGRRGSNPSSLINDDQWWALGQHHGLKTPLLDWTTSPFVAAYFAFIAVGPGQTNARAIYALWQPSIEEASEKIRANHKGTDPAPVIEFPRPQSDDNPRLVNQSGLFTRAPDGIDIETWVRSNFTNRTQGYICLKLTIPDSERLVCLRSLNRMNINHLTLFPDLYGASKHCNTDLDIAQY